MLIQFVLIYKCQTHRRIPGIPETVIEVFGINVHYRAEMISTSVLKFDGTSV